MENEKALQFEQLYDEQDAEYLDGQIANVSDPSNVQDLFCDFESFKRKDAKKLRNALRGFGFIADLCEEDERVVHTVKPVLISQVRAALNTAMLVAKLHASELVSLGLVNAEV